MLSVVDRPRPAEGQSQKGAPSLRLAGRPRRRGLLTGSVAVLVTCAALFAFAYTQAGRHVAVLVVARAVPPGAVVTRDDLTTASISATGRLSAIPARDAASIVGRHAAVGLVAGELLTYGAVASGGGIPAGDAVVGVAARPSQLPAEGVSAGEAVDVVLTGIPGSPALIGGASVATGGPDGAGGPSAAQPTALSSTVLVPHALVVGVALPAASSSGSSSATTVVSVLVPHAVAAVVATASAAGQVALVAVEASR